jgi:hypothetical protein
MTAEFSTEIEQFLTGARIPLRLATDTAAGWPVVVSLWFVPLAGGLWCATQDSAVIIKHLRRDSRCGFEVSTDQIPYKGVRGRATATLHSSRGEEILRVLLNRYLGGTASPLAKRLLSRCETEVAIEIVPASVHAWDFRERMSGSPAE